MRLRPQVIAFDVIETLFSLEPVSEKLQEAGLPAHTLAVWYARTLRDGMALTAVGEFKPFQDVARATLGGLLAEHSKPPADDTVEKIVSAFGELPPHADVRPSLELLHSAGISAMMVTNGSAKSTEKLLAKAGLSHLVQKVVSIDEVQAWKPARALYLQALLAARVEAGRMALVAAHAWDLQGAAAAGLTTGWIPRREKRFSDAMRKPDVKGATLLEVMQQLLSLPAANG